MDKFFTKEALGTVSGCAFLVWLIVNAMRTFFGLAQKWLVLLASAIVNGAIFAAASEHMPRLTDDLIISGNILVVAFAALGLQETTVKGIGKTAGGEENSSRRLAWRSSWFE